MALPKVPPDLPDLVRTAFNKALGSGDVFYFPTQVAILRVNAIPFQLRFSPSLANKPKPTPPPPSSPHDRQTPPDPFASPAPALLIAPGACAAPTHFLVLNKFAVVRNHSILATAAFAPQTHLLGAADLSAAWACALAYRARGEGLFVFYNSGVGSGASQRRRHLQLVPVGNMREGVEGEGEGWDLLVDRLGEEGEKEGVPFWSARAKLGGEMTGDGLREVYLRLYREACVKVGLGEDQVREDGEAALSYNLALTTETMVLCPRVADGAAVLDEQGKAVGRVELNGTVLAGTALVKNEAEWNALRADPKQLAAVLGKIGVSPA